MVKKPNRQTASKSSKKRLRNSLGDVLPRWRGGSIWQKLLLAVLAVFIAMLVSGFIISQWYIQKHKDEPLIIGTTFISDYAEKFGLEPRQTMEAILSDLGVKRIRLVSYWKEIEPIPGKYNFSQLDWQFALANEYGADVSLAIGLRQPRWPECHEPAWVRELSKEQWQPKLYDFMGKVIERYKKNPALSEYQLENEFFMEVFGECTDFDRQRLIDEFNFVKERDPSRPVIINRSNNWVGLPLGEPRPDKFGISIYKRVWDASLTKRYFEYPLPARFYGMLAGWGEIFTGRDMLIHELQAEPWTPHGKEIADVSVTEQYKSMNPERIEHRIQYGIDTGMRTLDLWGAEWWYWLKEVKGDPSVWDVVKKAVVAAEIENHQRLENQN